ncbi:hypothetical protein KXX11_001188 [Aspergillus fumigatus]|nr:hypothetical protein KXX11_001188 [Aspergillus fumigatus]
MTPAFGEELLEAYTDLELAHYITCSPKCVSSSRVFYLSSNLIAKHYEPSDVEGALKATEVASQRGIRCPSVRKISKNHENVYVSMNRVEGTTLDVIWKELGWFMTVKLGLQLRRCLSGETIATVFLPIPEIAHFCQVLGELYLHASSNAYLA